VGVKAALVVEVGLEVGGLDARRLLPRLPDLDRVALLLFVERLDLRVDVASVTSLKHHWLLLTSL